MKLILKKLVKLSLKKNKIIDLKGIENFPNLNYLKLSRNNIASLIEVKRLGNIPELKGVSLYRNPINDDKKLYAGVILGICKNLESLDHTSVEEIRKKYGLSEDQEDEGQGSDDEIEGSDRSDEKEDNILDDLVDDFETHDDKKDKDYDTMQARKLKISRKTSGNFQKKIPKFLNNFKI